MGQRKLISETLTVRLEEVLGIEVWIPDPFPMMKIQGFPAPLNPPICFEEDGAVKGVGVRVVGTLPDLEIQWGAMHQDLSENWVWDPDNTIVQEMDRRGFLMPQSARGAVSHFLSREAESWRWPGSE